MKNLLFIMTDQFEARSIGALGSCAITPNLDRLAEGGTVYDNCYSNAPLCMPARTALATGLYPRELNSDDNYGEGLTDKSVTWMQAIRDFGYETSLFGKAHLHKFPQDMRDRANDLRNYGYQIVNELPGPRTYGLKKSDYYDYLEKKGLIKTYQDDMEQRVRIDPPYCSRPTPLNTEDYADVYIGRQAVEYLSSVDSAKPWFCTVSFGGPHDPWDCPKEFVDLYSGIPMPKALPKPVSENKNRPRGVYDEILSGKYDPLLTDKVLAMKESDIEAIRRSYYGHVTLIDSEIGKIISVLKERKMLENTIIVFTSDHGEQNGDYGLLFKQTFLESSIKVPLIISTPESDKRKDVSTPVELMDLGPTLCNFLGISNLRLGHARPLPASDDVPGHRKTVAAQVFGETMVLKNGIKAVFNRNEEIYLLFDLNTDKSESRNLAGTKEATGLEKDIRNAYESWKTENEIEYQK